MYKNKIITINNSTKIIKFQIKDELITIQIFLTKLQNEDFQEELLNAIKNTGFENYMIKTIPFTNEQLDNTFEVGITKTHFTSSISDFSKFNKYMDTKKYFVSFKSLSGNILLVPHPFNGEINKENYKKYIDISGFIKYAPKEKLKLFWNNVKKIAKKLLDEKKKFYLQTIGHDVPYFHFRFVFLN